jgi:hypothetical protein
MYGMVNEGPLNEPLGAVICKEGRMLCWPNVFQHRVAPFRLSDPSRPGVRKIAVLWLVNPNSRIVSTRNVPPQQLAWFDAEADVWGCLPDDVKQRLDLFRDFPISLKKAKELRLELMSERKTVVKENSAFVFEREFSLCEH